MLLVGEGLHLRIARHLVGGGDVVFRAHVLPVPRHHGLDVGALAGQCPIAVHVAHGVLGGQVASSSARRRASDSSLLRSEDFIVVEFRPRRARE